MTHLEVVTFLIGTTVHLHMDRGPIEMLKCANSQKGTHSLMPDHFSQFLLMFFFSVLFYSIFIYGIFRRHYLPDIWSKQDNCRIVFMHCLSVNVKPKISNTIETNKIHLRRGWESVDACVYEG